MRLSTLLLCVFVCVAPAVAHDELSPTQVGRRKLAFSIPYLYGSTGLTLPNLEHEAHFDSAFQNNFGPFNSAIGSQLSNLPIPSPASGFTYSFDKSLGVYTRSAQSFGPVLAERAETVGKDKLSFGFNYQSFGFDSIDGQPLSRIPVVFQHAASTSVFATDVITTDNFVDLRIGQTTAFITYGLLDRVDVSVAVPFVSASLAVTSNATIQRIGSAGDPLVHSFSGSADRRQSQFFNTSTAQGIGDLVARIKATAFKAERAGLALGMDLRLPTGDAYDFLGSGAMGIKPFAALSFGLGPVSPHVNVGYQWNSKSVLAGNVITGEKASLPDQLQWIAGFDAGLTKKFTLSLDVIGQNVRDVERVFPASFTASNGARFENTRFAKDSFDAMYGAAGFKINAVGNLLASFNVLFRINEGGLQDKVTPMVGLSYAF